MKNLIQKRIFQNILLKNDDDDDDDDDEKNR